VKTIVLLSIFSFSLKATEPLFVARLYIDGYKKNPQAYFSGLNTRDFNTFISLTSNRSEPEILFLREVFENFKKENLEVPFESIKESPNGISPLTILDTGFDFRKFSNYVFRQKNFIGYDTGDNDTNPQNYHPHGTKMAEIAVWVFENYGKMVNLTHNKFFILPIKIFSLGDFSNNRNLVINNLEFSKDKRLFDAIEIAKKYSSKIINISFEGEFIYEDYFAIKNHPEMLFVVSAGNHSIELLKSNSWPAKLAIEYGLENVFVVGALDTNNLLSINSNYGNGVHIYTDGQFGDEATTSSATIFISSLLHILSLAFPDKNVFQIKNAMIDCAKNTELVSLKNNTRFLGKTFIVDRDFEEVIKKLKAQY